MGRAAADAIGWAGLGMILQKRMSLCLLCTLLSLIASQSKAAAADIPANPTNYKNLLRTLKPGDTLTLAGGRYPRLPIAQLNGTTDGWITITGPAAGEPAVIVA